MNNTLLLNSCIDEFKTQNNLERYPEDELFELFCGIELTKDADTDFAEIEDAIVDGGGDGGIDSFLILFNDKSISSDDEFSELKFSEKSRIKFIIIQSKTSKSFQEGALDKLYISLPVIIDLSIPEEELKKRFNERLVSKILIFRETWIASIRKKSFIEVEIIYACKADEICINDAFNQKMEQLIGLFSKSIPSAKINPRLISAKELVAIYNYKKPVELELKFKEGPVPIPFTQTDFGYIGTVSISDYFNFIKNQNGQIREEIFENNIRHFQGDVDVNKKMFDTLKSDTVRDFWWLNNGITIITSSCRPIPKILYITDAQVVNGLQTSFSIFNNYDSIINKTERSVLVKIIISKDKETIDKVIEATNSQNAVPPVLLRATDNIQRLIEKYFISEGFFYDRRKNYYKNQGKPITKIFTIQDVAQAVEAILFRNPSTARKNPTTIIKSDESYQRIFNSDMDYSIYLKCSLIIRNVKLYINSLDDSSQKNFFKNYSFHISLFLLLYVTQKHNFTVDDIIRFDQTSIENDLLNDIINDFALILKKYSIESGENPINTAKSSAFDRHIVSLFKPSAFE